MRMGKVPFLRFSRFILVLECLIQFAWRREVAGEGLTVALWAMYHTERSGSVLCPILTVVFEPSRLMASCKYNHAFRTILNLSGASAENWAFE